ARVTTERANNDVWPSRRVRVIELSSSTIAAVKIGRDSATADPACAKMLALAATNRHKASVDVPVQNLRGSGSGKFPISHAVFASSFALGRDQAPVSRQAWTKGAADKSIVIEIPHGRSLLRGAVKRIIGLAVPVEVGRSDQSIAACNGRPECASDKRRAGQIPDCRLTGAGIEKQIIGFVIAIEVRHADHFPVSWKSWTKGAADKNVVI